MALTKEQLIEQGLSEEIAENILNQFNNEAKKIRESVQKREDVISKEDFIKLSNELDELKAFKDVPSIKIDGVPDVTVWSINFNKNNDTYFATQQGVYLLKSNEKVATKINGTEGDVRWITIDSNNICHFAMWQKGLFKWENNKLTK
ncbi:hypothetical protein [Spiroplasma endosymbiont of Polydrusus cervinus]|uniref:hypothetical protein n=1 Tax=Spiroplasma endosymbiont of Polydrusus cervinus TaxID=3066287 RepID=UPI0030D01AF2